jgi:hypothetical protein
VNRSLSTAVLGLAAAALSLTPAMAAPPEPASTVPEGVTLTACGYDVHATPSGKVKQIGLTTVFPNERVTLTNPETGNQTLVEDVDGLRLTDSQGKVLSVCGVLAP